MSNRDKLDKILNRPGLLDEALERTPINKIKKRHVRNSDGADGREIEVWSRAEFVRAVESLIKSLGEGDKSTRSAEATAFRHQLRDLMLKPDGTTIREDMTVSDLASIRERCLTLSEHLSKGWEERLPLPKIEGGKRIGKKKIKFPEQAALYANLASIINAVGMEYLDLSASEITNAPLHPLTHQIYANSGSGRLGSILGSERVTGRYAAGRTNLLHEEENPDAPGRAVSQLEYDIARLGKVLADKPAEHSIGPTPKTLQVRTSSTVGRPYRMNGWGAQLGAPEAEKDEELSQPEDELGVWGVSVDGRRPQEVNHIGPELSHNTKTLNTQETHMPAHAEAIEPQAVESNGGKKHDKKPALVYVDSFGYKLMSIRAHKGISEGELADRVNQKVDLDIVVDGNIKDWENNKHLEMLKADPRILSALKFVLIESNDKLNDEQKVAAGRELEEILNLTIAEWSKGDAANSRLLRGLTNELSGFIKEHRQAMDYSEKDLADCINMRISDQVYGETKRVTVQDIIDLQSNQKVPDELLVSRLATALGLSETEREEFKVTVNTKKKESVKLVGSLEETLRTEVLVPLSDLLKKHNVREGMVSADVQRIKNMFEVGFPVGKAYKIALAEQTLSGWFDTLRKGFEEKDVPKDEYEPLLDRWKELHADFLQHEHPKAHSRA